MRASLALAALLDVAFGEPPPAIHPVVWMGRCIGWAEQFGLRRRKPETQFHSGSLIVLCGVATSAASSMLALRALRRAPWPVRLLGQAGF